MDSERNTLLSIRRLFLNKKNILKNIIMVISIIAIFFAIFSYITKSKKIKIGNTSSSQEMIENILNISSYESMIEVEVHSNKNVNKYIIKQTYIAPNISEQEILEPENIQGVKMTKTENELKIENTKLNLTKIYTNYPYMTDNCLDLSTFIELYKQNGKIEYEEKDDEIILKTENKKNIYTQNRTLYIDKKTGKPTKMEIKGNSKNTLIYILYKEVKFQ